MATEQNIHSAAEWEDIPAEKFEIIGTDDFSGDIIARPKIGYWADAWRRLKENKIALVALIVLLLLIVMVCIGPLSPAITSSRWTLPPSTRNQVQSTGLVPTRWVVTCLLAYGRADVFRL